MSCSKLVFKVTRSKMAPPLIRSVVFFCLILSCANCKETTKDRPEGTIDDLFTDKETEYYSDRYEKLKALIGVDEGQADRSMKHILKALERQLEMLHRKGDAAAGVIPETTLDKILKNNGRLPENVAAKVRKRGVLIVRNTIPDSLVHEWMADLVKYLYANQAFPKDKNQTVYEVYWSRSQLEARQHPNMLSVQKALLQLWHVGGDNEVNVNLSKPSTYVDRLRIRQPGDASFHLPPHIDGGGIERWLDPTYRTVYRHILSGNWEKYDPFEVDYRVEANMNDVGYANGCTFFRAFQGWLSMSPSGPGHGTLRVLPVLKEATAYWMLRPFLRDVPPNLFPGCYPGKTFHISEQWHSDLHKHLISIPKVNPGDTVWWHADTIHSVESQHLGDEPNSVFYIPTGPECRINRDYLRRMRHSFVLGSSPPDFPVNNYEVDYVNRGSISHLTPAGREAAGLPPSAEDDMSSGHCVA